MIAQSWLCTVCGYIHHGDGGLASCPICDAGAELFTPHSRPSTAPSAPVAHAWRCLNCDDIASGDAPPPACPVCGVDADRFTPHAESIRTGEKTSAPATIVIAGAGIAGVSAAAAARQQAPEASITLITREPDLPYYRLNLTRYLAGEIPAETLPIHPESWYSEQRIDVLRDTELQQIDRAAHQLHLKDGNSLSYDKLILALGAHPIVPAIEGATRENIIALRTRRDCAAILARCTTGTRCVVVGGGVLGLETAAALSRRGAKVQVLEGFGWLLPRQLNRAAGELLAATVRELGIELFCNARIKQFDGDQQVCGVRLETGELYPAELVVIAAGVRGNSYLARMAGLEVNNGVVVDNRLRTSDPDIFAVGDVAEHQGVTYGTWAPAQFQGTIGGMNAAGAALDFAGIPRSNILKVLDVNLFSIGQVHPDDGSYHTFESLGKSDGSYRYLVFRDTRLVGAILIGDTGLASKLKQLIETNRCCTELLAGASAEALCTRIAAA
ncbi:MAG: FAD-dependent oxidoreductase [Desulfuromonadales bacterium]|nr:FAD-dependent oxidoreductase [Desulfuromonadales bacterium]